jgi:hypothetical protein
VMYLGPVRVKNGTVILAGDEELVNGVVELLLVVELVGMVVLVVVVELVGIVVLLVLVELLLVVELVVVLVFIVDPPF